MAGWHHWLNGHGFGWTPGVGDGQGGLACCDSRGWKMSDTTERLIWSDHFQSSNNAIDQVFNSCSTLNHIIYYEKTLYFIIFNKFNMFNKVRFIIRSWLHYLSTKLRVKSMNSGVRFTEQVTQMLHAPVFSSARLIYSAFS